MGFGNMRGYDSWKTDGGSNVCERCGSRYSDADGRCYTCRGCETCGELFHADDLNENDECEECALHCRICWDAPHALEFNGDKVCQDCHDELSKEVQNG